MSPSGTDLVSGGGDWSEWRRLVLAALEDTKRELEAGRRKMVELETKITILETKLVTWGALAGFISAAISTVIINRFLS